VFLLSTSATVWGSGICSLSNVQPHFIPEDSSYFQLMTPPEHHGSVLLLSHPSGDLSISDSWSLLAGHPDADQPDIIGLAYYRRYGFMSMYYSTRLPITFLAPARIHTWKKSTTGRFVMLSVSADPDDLTRGRVGLVYRVVNSSVFPASQVRHCAPLHLNRFRLISSRFRKNHNAGEAKRLWRTDRMTRAVISVHGRRRARSPHVFRGNPDHVTLPMGATVTLPMEATVIRGRLIPTTSSHRNSMGFRRMYPVSRSHIVETLLDLIASTRARVIRHRGQRSE
jgi:hypothetical protein